MQCWAAQENQGSMAAWLPKTQPCAPTQCPPQTVLPVHVTPKAQGHIPSGHRQVTETPVPKSLRVHITSITRDRDWQSQGRRCPPTDAPRHLQKQWLY